MATQPLPESRIDFEHVLAILPPVADAGDILWFAYLDEPTKWHRCFPAPDSLLLAAGDMLKKLLAYECDPAKGGQDRTPNRTIGTQREIPNIAPRWKVRVTATLGRTGEAEWMFELLDDSAWGVEGDDLRGLLMKLTKRIGDTAVAPQPLLSTVPEPEQLANLKQPSTLTDVVRLETARVDKQLGLLRERIAEAREKERALVRQRRALQAARQSYETHMRPQKGVK